MDHLDEVVRLSQSISSLIETEEYSKLESLFASRGQEIAVLSELEKALGRLLNDSPDMVSSQELERYNTKRGSLIRDIMDVDAQASHILTTSKDSVLEEMKELYRGRKMNEGYLNPKKIVDSFIDTKE